jgi:Protein of unknown function (DUF4058)
MPLHDHFQPPIDETAPWAGLHTVWSTFITGQLNQGKLPPGYFAVPSVHLGVTLEADVGTLEKEEENSSNGEPDAGGVATAVWAPPAPPLLMKTNLADLDVVEVQVFLKRELRLVAVVELVSPANKDRPTHRTAFVSKVAGYLQHEVGVIVVDVVTECHENLHAELMRLLDAPEDATLALASDLYAAAYRATGKGKRARLEIWPAPLAIGLSLPTLPLWIAPARAVPLDLESSYTTACRVLSVH